MTRRLSSSTRALVSASARSRAISRIAGALQTSREHSNFKRRCRSLRNLPAAFLRALPLRKPGIAWFTQRQERNKRNSIPATHPAMPTSKSPGMAGSAQRVTRSTVFICSRRWIPVPPYPWRRLHLRRPRKVSGNRSSRLRMGNTRLLSRVVPTVSPAIASTSGIKGRQRTRHASTVRERNSSDSEAGANDSFCSSTRMSSVCFTHAWAV